MEAKKTTPSVHGCRAVLVGILAIAVLAGCSSGGSSPSGSSSSGGTAPSQSNTSGSSTAAPSTTYTPGVYPPASEYADYCASPRTGIDPVTGQPWPDMQGSILDEDEWLRSWTHNTYLWYSEVPDIDPAGYTPLQYFNLMKTTAVTPSGAPKDRFHFTMPTSQWLSLSQSGVSAGYGATFTIISSSPPRSIVVAYTQPNSPATSATVHLARGATILEVDGVDAVNGDTTADINALNAGLFPTSTGETHTFTVQDYGSSTTRQITMTSAAITEQPVQDVHAIDVNGEKVGYMLFTDQIATAEKELISAINQLKSAGVSDLVLDLRYNGGGYLDIASELAYMIAGPTSAGQTFEKEEFNDQHPYYDPVTGQPIEPTPFYSTSQGFSATTGEALPSLDLPRVYVITGSGTCSASESIINGLRGIGVTVHQIGSTTCGKPYGFYPTDDCGTTYFSIQFRGVNAQGFGNYPDGFSPDNVANPTGVPLPGCQVADDFTHALGDTHEARLSAALQYLADGTCPAVSGVSSANPPGITAKPSLSAADGYTPKAFWLKNRILAR